MAGSRVPSGDGRYAEKGGGQQVGSFFTEAADNEKIKAIYGNYGFWSWTRYWYLDSENYLTLMLLDKGYYDYDFEPVKAKRVLTAEDKELWSSAKLNAILGVKPKRASVADLQAEVRAMRKSAAK